MKNNWSLLKNDNLTALQGNKTDFYCSRQIKSLQLRTDNQTCADGAALLHICSCQCTEKLDVLHTRENIRIAPCTHTHTHNSTPIGCITTHQNVSPVVWSGKMALNQRTASHRRATADFQQSLLGFMCRHMYACTPLRQSLLVHTRISDREQPEE